MTDGFWLFVCLLSSCFRKFKKNPVLTSSGDCDCFDAMLDESENNGELGLSVFDAAVDRLFLPQGI
jgi:hypothetical protein